MRAEIIAFGDELTHGQRLDTNSQWLAEQLSRLGLDVGFHTCVGDDLNDSVAMLRLAATRSRVVLCTGGLGPTADDLTRQALADAFERPLSLDAEALERIQAMFARRQRPMPPQNEVQAYFPDGSRPIPNPHGSAPGIDLTIGREPSTGPSCRFFALPGVPSEMRQMWEETVVPRLRDEMGVGRAAWWYRTFKCFGIGESDVEVLLPELIRRGRQPLVGITVSRATISLRIAARAASWDQFRAEIAETEQQIETALGDLIFGFDNDELQDVVARRVAQRQESLASVEVGACNLIGGWLSQAAGERYRGNLHFGSRVTADKWLASLPARPVAASVAAADGNLWGAADSADELPTADRRDLDDKSDAAWLGQLASAWREVSGADWCLASGCYPSRDQIVAAPAMQPFPWSWGIAGPGGQLWLASQPLGGHPDVLLHRLAKTSLDQLRRRIEAVS
jgi:nicotinamide-nucleotide amidase